MKNKYLKYVLVVATVLLWGGIIYRIIDAVKGNDIPSTISSTPSVNINNYPTPKRYILISQYADPFLKEFEPVEETTITKDTIAIKVPSPPVDMSFIRYLGMISNTSNKRKIGLLNLNGVDYMAAEGDEVAGVKVVKITERQVRVMYKGERKEIEKLRE